MNLKKNVILYSLFLLFALDSQSGNILSITKEGFTEIEGKMKTIKEPTYAIVNIKGIESMPISKTDVKTGIVEFYDEVNGIYFSSEIELKAQGNSTLSFDKKNFTLGFLGDTNLKIGDWVSQDSYHLKAYYCDKFRGIAVCGYKLWNEIANDRGFPLFRTEGTSDGNALYHPDGFPCSVYLNDEFYGIYCWQLKKHRKNYNLKKDNPKNIQLDGYLSDHRLWNGTIVWTDFEVRNPKVLYTMDGNLYDGDNPKELIDENSPFFYIDGDTDEVKKDKERTQEVKNYIIALSNLNQRLTVLENKGASTEMMRSEIETYIDVPGCLDYVCFHLSINNRDGFDKNWQWFTFDGKKWFVAPYDLDCTFGYFFTGNFLLPAEMNWVWPDELFSYDYLYTEGPMRWIVKYYFEDIKTRYKELRDKKIIDVNNILNFIKDWYYRVGEDNYNSEWERWPNSPCLKEIVPNTSWEYKEGWPDYVGLKTWSDKVTYMPGEKVKCERLVWEAKEQNTGQIPYLELGFQDNLERIFNWINKRIELEDDFMSYHTTTTVPSYVIKVTGTESIYSISGVKTMTPKEGIYISWEKWKCKKVH